MVKLLKKQLFLKLNKKSKKVKIRIMNQELKVKIGDKIEFTSYNNEFMLDGTIVEYNKKTKRYKVDIGLGSVQIELERIKRIIK